VTEDGPGTDPRRARGALVVLSLAAFILVATELLPVGLLTVIAADLDRSRSQVGLLVGGYAVVVVLASVPLTLVTRRIPRRGLLGVTLLLFTAANVLAAVAHTYPVLAGARVITALTQALFWSVAPPVVTGLFPVEVRGRVVALFATGPALSPVLGVPLATWLGLQAGWRSAFAAVAVVGLAGAAAVFALIPSYPPDAGGAARGTAPDRGRFVVLLGGTAIGITGFFTFTTYVSPFLLDVGGFTDAALPALLFVSGAAGISGTVAVSRTLDARPIVSLLTPVGIGAVALLGMFALGTLKPAAVLLLGGVGLGYASFATAIQNRMFQVAPGSTDLASAGTGTAFNAGIATGSLIGGGMLGDLGPRPLALAGGLLTLVAFLTLAADAARPRRRERAGALGQTARGR
jgi:predicted MFS family arabinose efflux permease